MTPVDQSRLYWSEITAGVWVRDQIMWNLENDMSNVWPDWDHLLFPIQQELEA